MWIAKFFGVLSANFLFEQVYVVLRVSILTMYLLFLSFLSTIENKKIYIGHVCLRFPLHENWGTQCINISFLSKVISTSDEIFNL